MATSTAPLSIHETGTHHATTLILLHGGGVGGWMWQPQIDVLAQQYHCLVPDLPEQGASRQVQPFTMQGAAQHIADLIATRAHGGQAHVIGLSLGAQVTTALLALAPERVQSAIISSALLRPVMGSSWYTPSVLRWTFNLTVAPLRNNQWYARFNMKQAAGIPDRYFPQFFEEFRHTSATNFASYMSANMQFRLPAGLDRCSARVLVVVGKKELKPMHTSARDLLAALPNARGVVVDAGKNAAENHNWSMTAPELFTRMVQAWVSQQSLPAELQSFT